MQMTESDENSTYTYGVVSNLSTLKPSRRNKKVKPIFYYKITAADET